MNNSNPFSSTKSRILIGVVSFSYLFPILLFGILSPLLPENTAVKYAKTIISALIVGAVALWAIRKDNIELETIGFRKTKIQQAALILLIGWIVFTTIFLIVLTATGESVIPYFGKPRLVFQQWLFVGMGEELLFRGYLLTNLLAIFARLPAKWRTLLALFIGNGVFATMHIPVVLYKAAGQERAAELLSYIPAVFLVGLILSYFFLRTRNILLTGLIHGSINAPLIGKEDDPITLLVLVVVFFLVTELWMFVQSKLNSTGSPDLYAERLSD